MNSSIIEIEKEVGEVHVTSHKAENICHQEGALTEALRNCSMCSDDLLVNNYAEMVLQFTYVVLWSSVFPLTPLVAVLLNFGTLRFEIIQLSSYTRRGIPKKEEGIGAWLTIIEIISLIGVVTNSAMIIITFKAREKIVYYFNATSSAQIISGGIDLSSSSSSIDVPVPTNSSIDQSELRYYLSNETNFLWLIICLEHFIIILKLMLREYIGDVPEWVSQAKLTEKFDEIRVQEAHELLLLQEKRHLMQQQLEQLEQLEETKNELRISKRKSEMLETSMNKIIDDRIDDDEQECER